MESKQVGDEFLLDREYLPPGDQPGQGHLLLHRCTSLKSFDDRSKCLESALSALSRRGVRGHTDQSRLAKLITELLDNAYLHGVYRRGISETYPTLFELFELSSGTVCVRVSNLMDSSVRETLDSRLTELAHKSPSEIADLYWERMRKGGISVLGGAGAGLSSVFRIAMHVAHSFESVNARTCYLSIWAYYKPHSA